MVDAAKNHQGVNTMAAVTQQFDHVLLKVWFGGAHTSRNFINVIAMTREGSALTIENNSGTTYLLNWNNINMIEEIYNE